MKGNELIKRKNVIAILIAITMLFGLFSQTVFAEGTPTYFIAFTSDVHNNTSNLQTWLNRSMSSGTTTLDYMVFGGDYEGFTVAAQCVSIVSSTYSGTPSVLVKGNHDNDGGTYAAGLVYSGSDYAIYSVDSSSQSFSTTEISNLDAALKTIDPSVPVFVASHCPLHYFNSRTTGNAAAMVEVLNNYPNVIFLWGHNHTVNDTNYGTVKVAGNTIQCSSTSSPVTINFTYANFGAMNAGTQNAYGMLATLAKTSSGTTIDFDYKNLSGTTTSSYSVTIEDDTPNEEINDVAITVTAPEPGDVPNTDAVVSGPFEGSSYTVSWNPNPTAFDYETSYMATVVLTAPSGYSFTSGVTATVNGYDATAVLDSGTLTVTYTFTTAAGSTETTYELASSVEEGATYLIVAESGSDYYALTTSSTTISSVSYLLGSAATISDDKIVSTVSDSMLWVFTADGDGYDIMNGSYYLNRVSGTSGGIEADTTEDGSSYSDWIFDGTNHNLTTISSSQVTFYLYVTNSGSTYYFRNSTSTTYSGMIYLYKLTEGTGSTTQIIDSVEIADLTDPVGGVAPDTNVTVSSGITDPGAAVWMPEVTDTFAYSTTYTASVTLTAQSGYEFASDATMTVNGNAATCTTLNTDGTLTVTYTFNATGADPNGPTYELASSIEDGETYVITALSGSDYYALTNVPYSTTVMTGTSVTVTNAAITSTVTDDMLWKFDAHTDSTYGDGYTIRDQDGIYLIRVSGQSGGLYIQSEDTYYITWSLIGTQLKNLHGSQKFSLSLTGTNFTAVTSSYAEVYLFKVTEPAGGTVSEVDISITAPEGGATPATSATVSTNGVTAGTVTWTPTVSSTFAYNTAYTASVTLTPNANYTFASTVSVSVNGGTAVEYTPGSGTLTVTYAFEATGEEPITSVVVTDITTPIAGAEPDTTASVSIGTAGTVTWTPTVSSTFTYSTAYTAGVTLTAPSGYEFTSGTAVTVNGNAATSTTLNADGTLTVTYTFDETGADPNVPTYELATSIEDGETYVIAALSDTDYYALTTTTFTSGSYSYLEGEEVTVSNDKVTSTVSDDMLWIFTADGNGYNVMNGSNYLTRKSSGSPGVYLTTDDEGSAYNEWMYVYGSSGSQLRLLGGSGGSTYFYLYLTSSSGTYYFANTSSTAYSTLYLFKYTEATNVSVSSVAVTDIDTPVAGATPDTAAATSTTGVTVSAVSWSPNVTTFGYGTQYTATVTLTAQSGYEFASGATVTIDDHSAAVTDNGDGTLNASYQFDATANQQITSVAITGITEPAAGGIPDTTAETVTEGATITGDVTWTPNDSTFAYNKVYTASVTLTVQTGYQFTTGTTATVNGVTASSATASGDGSTLTVTYAFPLTGMETPSITAQPQSVTAAAGGTAELSVSASVTDGGTLSYQWYSNSTDSSTGGTSIGSATASSYSAPTNTVGIIYYYCVVTNSDGVNTDSKTATTQTAAVTVKLASIQSSDYTVDTANGILSMVSAGTSANGLKAKLLNDMADIKIFNGETEYTGDTVATGMTVRYYVNGAVQDELKISVFGDASGDGVINVNDILYLRAQIIGAYAMSACEAAAADINGDMAVNIIDILYVRAHILGDYTINAK
ncbi:MAG TPA: metallophosphoesterase [Oscillospiraceae bacterium]|mgnify:CR=1 FL=1|nr:metallophosphoesterase [Oscillospiraceae bacterium]